jgi:hypothetical protein
MASLFRLRTVGNQTRCLPRPEWNLLPQHRAMLPLEQAIENYMFPLVRGPHQVRPVMFSGFLNS